MELHTMPEQHFPVRSIGRYYRPVRNFLIREVLHAGDPPHRMALGCAIGVFVTFLPIVGFQMVVVVLLASFLRANKVVGLPIVWISNPATLVPIFYGCYVVGRRILGHAAIGSHWWMELRSPPEGWWESTWFYYSRIMDIAWPLWTGCLVVGAAAAIPAYAVAYGLVSYLRARAFAKKSADISVLGQPDGESAVCKGDGGE